LERVGRARFGFLKRRTVSTTVSPCLDIFNVSTARIDSNSLSIPLKISGKTEDETVETLALIDSGDGGIFINQNYARNSGLEIQQLEKPLKVFNVDGTSNKRGTIKYFIQLDITINGQQENVKFLMTGLGKQRIILGFPWLNKHNPEINWKTLLHQTHDEKKKDVPLKEQIPEEYHEFLDVFDKEKADRFPDERVWDHKIELKDGFVPKSFKNYNLTPVEQVELDKFLKENLEKGYIRPSKSPMASPFFFVSKKDAGKLRPCQDYRYLNDWTIKNAYPLPLISEIIDKLKGAKYFTKLDVRWGYNNIRIKKGDEWKAAFKTNRGLFEPTVMFFGMCNSPATFQAMMDSIFDNMISDTLLIGYMDNLFIFEKELGPLIANTKSVLKQLRDNDLYLKPLKCEFHKTKVEYLGMVIEEGKISMDTSKLKGIQDWPVPTTIKQVRGFLGFGNFYRRFILNFSDIARPLNELLKKDRKFDWTPECQSSFEEMKKRFTEEPVLAMPDHSRPFQIESDASKYATGAVLSQLDSNGDWHPVVFYSKTFSPAERNYDIHDRELLAIIRALEAWRHYIQGSGHTTIVLSDHQNLIAHKEAKKLNRRQARWFLFLSEYDIKLVHTPGKQMILSDALSPHI